jgi:hypothetical protein
LIPESGRLEFEEFITLAAKFIIEEDAEAMEKELREAFRLYDKEGMLNGFITGIVAVPIMLLKTKTLVYRKLSTLFPKNRER